MTASADPTDQLVSRAFCRRMGDSAMITALVAAGTDFTGHAKAAAYRGALTSWYRSPTGTCIACRGAFSAVPPAAFLLAASTARASATLACGICLTCWAADDPATLEAACTRVLRRVKPGGVFLDHPQNKTAASGHDAAAKKQIANNDASASTDAKTRQSKRGAAHE